ncbi:MAG: helix-turn-helix transcriptional regulator, partial [bacterium]
RITPYLKFRDKNRLVLTFRLLHEAVPGPWCMSIQAKLNNGTVLPQQNFPFFVTNRIFNLNETVKPNRYIQLFAAILAAILLLTFLIWLKLKNNTPLLLRKQDPLFIKAADKIREDIDKSITVSDLAGYLNVSISKCYKLFKKNAGTSAVKYILEEKLETAKNLLETTELSVTEVQFKVGFNNAPYFSRTFKKRFGVSPGAFKKSNKAAK